MENNIINLNNNEEIDKTTVMDELERKLDSMCEENTSLRNMLHWSVDLVCDTLFDEVADIVPANDEEADKLVEWFENKFEGKGGDEIAQMILDKLG